MSTIDGIECPDMLTQATKAWFAAWKSDPITDDWGPAQVQYLVDTAFVHSLVWSGKRPDLVVELGKREQTMGVRFHEPKPQSSKQRAGVLQMVIDEHRQIAGGT